MEIKLITSPREGLVVWYTDDPDKQPCPAVITACLDSSCLVTTLGSQKSIRSAKMHQLSTFERHLSNAIVLSPAKHNRLRVACAAAPDYANSDVGIPTQRAHLSSASYGKFLDEIRQKSMRLRNRRQQLGNPCLQIFLLLFHRLCRKCTF